MQNKLYIQTFFFWFGFVVSSISWVGSKHFWSIVSSRKMCDPRAQENAETTETDGMFFLLFEVERSSREAHKRSRAAATLSRETKTMMAIVGIVVTVVAVVAATEEGIPVFLSVVRTRDEASQLSRDGDTWKSGGGWGSKEASGSGGGR